MAQLNESHDFSERGRDVKIQEDHEESEFQSKEEGNWIFSSQGQGTQVRQDKTMCFKILMMANFL